MCEIAASIESLLRKLLKMVSDEEGNPAGLSSCSGGLRPLVELCVEPAGLCGTMHGGGSAPSCWAFPHRVAFEEGSGRPGQSSLSAGALRYRAWGK